jgi:large subunit ribosomal protein L3
VRRRADEGRHRARLRRRCSWASSKNAGEGEQADGGALQEGERAGHARAREVKVAAGGAETPKVGDQVLASIFALGERVDIVGAGRGKGLPGCGQAASFRRRRGDARVDVPSRARLDRRSSFPSRVVKGMRAAGRMGGGA